MAVTYTNALHITMTLFLAPPPPGGMLRKSLVGLSIALLAPLVISLTVYALGLGTEWLNVILSAMIIAVIVKMVRSIGGEES